MKPIKRKATLILIVLLLLFAGFLTGRRLAGSKPFQNLTLEEIATVEVQLLPPDVTLSLTREDIAQLVPILNQVVVYSRDNSFQEYSGQAVIYTITRTDGSYITVQAYNPFMVINGVGFRTKYEPCEALNSFGNRLNSD